MDIQLKDRDHFEQVKEENNKALFPVVFSDRISTKGIRTTASSKMLENYVPPFDATIVERIKEAGGVILGKSAGREFGVGDAENPFGTSAAVANDESIMGFSTSYKGSNHLGAHKYGLFSYLPTYGLVSRYGVIPVASSLDRVGIISKTFENLPKAMDIVSGKDEKDSTSFDCDGDFSNLDDLDLRRVSFANVNVFGDLKNVEVFFEKIQSSLKSLQIDCLKYAIPAYDIISSGEFATNMQRFDGISFGYRSDHYNNVEELYKNSRTEGLGKAVQEKIILGNFVLSEGRYEAYYVQAMKARTMIKESMEKEMETFEFLIGPVNPDYMAALDLAGLPSLFIPFEKEGLLISTRAFNDKRLFEFGKAIVSRLEGDQ